MKFFEQHNSWAEGSCLPRAVYYAVTNGNTILLEELQKLGARLEGAVDQYDSPPMHWITDPRLCLSDEKICNMIKYLTCHGVPIDQTNKNNSTALETLRWQVSDSNLDHVCTIGRCLVEHGANIEDPRNTKTTLLFNAINGENSLAVKMLLQLGASTTVTNKEGETPLQHIKAVNAKLPAPQDGEFAGYQGVRKIQRHLEEHINNLNQAHENIRQKMLTFKCSQHSRCGKGTSYHLKTAMANTLPAQLHQLLKYDAQRNVEHYLSSSNH